MRKLSKGVMCLTMCVGLTAAAAATAGAQELHQLSVDAPITGVSLKVTDSLMIMGTKMFHTQLVFFSQRVPGLARDPARQEEFDKAGDRTKPRLKFALLYEETGDALDIVVHVPAEGRDAQEIMTHVALTERASARSAGRSIQLDTLDWSDKHREYRQISLDPKTNARWLIKCVPAMTPKTAGYVSCYEAHGPSVERTLAAGVQSLTAPGYTEWMTGKLIAPPAARRSVWVAITPSPESPKELGYTSGKIFNAGVGFVVSGLSSTLATDAAMQHLIDSLAIDGVAGWSLGDTVSSDLVAVSANTAGQWQMEEREWNGRRDAAIHGVIQRSPGSRVLEAKTDFRADTASYHFTLLDPQGVYHKSYCKGSAVGREKTVAVCVSTQSKRPDAFANMAEAFVLTRPGADPLTQIKEQEER